MAKTRSKTVPTQKDIGSFWQLALVAEKYGVPPTNIARASRKKLPGKPFIRSRRLSGGKGAVVFYEPDVAAYAKKYAPSRRERCQRNVICGRWYRRADCFTGYQLTKHLTGHLFAAVVAHGASPPMAKA